MNSLRIVKLIGRGETLMDKALPKSVTCFVVHFQPNSRENSHLKFLKCGLKGRMNVGCWCAGLFAMCGDCLGAFIINSDHVQGIV